MAIWSFSEQTVEQEPSSAPENSPSRCQFHECPTSPRLEVNEFDLVPFSHNFGDLFEGLGLHIPETPIQKCVAQGGPDISYDIQNFTNIREINPEWAQDEIEEIIVLSSKRPSSNLPTIQEDQMESSCAAIPTAALSDFDLGMCQTLSGTNCMTDPKPCTKRDTNKRYMVQSGKANSGAVRLEQAILETLTELSTAFLPSLLWAFQSGEQIYLVTDYYANGSLLEFINKHGSLVSNRALFLAAEIASAVSALHGVGIVHRDLNPANVMLDADGHVVLTNFRCASFLPQTVPNGDEGYDTTLSSFERDITEYQAPEIILGWAHNTAVDCWGFGILLYFMLFGSFPFGRQYEGVEDDSMLPDQIVQCPIQMESLRLVHPLARDLILKCLERNPVIRWDMKKIKKHAYFAQVDWEKILTKDAQVLPFVPSLAGGCRTVDASAKGVTSFKPPSPKTEQDLLQKDCPNESHRKKQTTRGLSWISLHDSSRSSMADLLRPVLKVTIPAALEEENETMSEIGTMGHNLPVAPDGQTEEVSPSVRMSRFWDTIDGDDRASANSINSFEFGESTGIPYSRVPKLRKHNSSIQTSYRLFSLSTTSFQNRLRMKTRSTGALRSSRPAEPIPDLPNGIHQMGSGIGFTHNLPTAMTSKLSLASFTPATCHGMFNGSFSGLNLGLGLGNSSRKTKTKRSDVSQSHIATTTLDEELGTGKPSPREVGNRTFVRDMYRTPSWILSPPDSVPSPMALVTSADSPVSDSEPLTPNTLVDSEEETEVNIIIPKNLDLEYDFPDGTPDSTLRLVPQTRTEVRMSFVPPKDDLFYSEM
ncbi:hypothetical protein B0H34DRAFT_855162 [Crassisporium funariophilum]|nr:hypothetical protein B0H34DRAFT_855162 [Crassisporium funariophilum]